MFKSQLNIVNFLLRGINIIQMKLQRVREHYCYVKFTNFGDFPIDPFTMLELQNHAQSFFEALKL